jgi:hypothetical protein
MEAKTQYLPDDLHDGGHATERFQWRLTPPRYAPLYDNKLISYRFLSSFGFPMAQIYGVFDPRVGHTMDGVPLRTTAELRRWLAGFSGEGFVLKPVEGALGYNVLVLTGRAEGDSASFITLTGDRYDAERLEAFAREGFLRLQNRTKRDARPYLLQERIHPHPEIQALVGGPTLSTTRVVTFVALDGQPRLLAASFRLQPGPVGADNFARGSVACYVDLEDGVLGRGRIRDQLADVTRVPGTDRCFVGFQLPDWAEVRKLALRAATTFPWARVIGWDIALSNRGPVLLEGNNRWDPALVQLPAPRGLMSGEFKALCDALAQPSKLKIRQGIEPR